MAADDHFLAAHATAGVFDHRKRFGHHFEQRGGKLGIILDG